MVDFISEVQEELRKDDYNKFLKKYGPYLLGLIIAVISATAYLEWDKSRDEKAARATSSAYLAAGQKVEDGNVDQAIREYLAISEQAPTGYSGLSLMRAAELELDRGNTQASISLLDQAANVFDNARHGQLAQIKAAYILAGEGRYDDVRVRVASLAEKDQPYEYLARELLGFAAKASGDTKAAKEQFSYLESIPGVPDTIRERAAQYLSLMSVEALDAEAEMVDAPTEIANPEDTTEIPEPETENVE